MLLNANLRSKTGRDDPTARNSHFRRGHLIWPLLALSAAIGVAGCSGPRTAKADNGTVAAPVGTVGVTQVGRKPIFRQLTVSSELVPFQEIDVYAKESGFVRDLRVDYGSRVKKGDLMAVLDIPELELQLQQDAATIKNQQDLVTRAEHEISRVEAQHKVYHLQYTRLNSVAESKPGLVAQQEVDDAAGKDFAAEAQVEAAKSALQSAQSELVAAQAKEARDRVLFDYSKIYAPFAGVVTQRYANLGTLMQAGTNSSTQAMPLVRLSQDDLFRLVIPVPESYVKFIRVGDPVQVRVGSLDKVFPGKVTRFSADVNADTRTMHTEVDVLNARHELITGVYAEATLMLDRKSDALVIPLQAISQVGDQATILLVDFDNRLEERKIKLGLQTASDAEVLSGLNEGDRVVVSDRSGLKAGMEVRAQTVDVLQYQGEKEQ